MGWSWFWRGVSELGALLSVRSVGVVDYTLMLLLATILCQSYNLSSMELTSHICRSVKLEQGDMMVITSHLRMSLYDGTSCYGTSTSSSWRNRSPSLAVACWIPSTPARSCTVERKEAPSRVVLTKLRENGTGRRRLTRRPSRKHRIWAVSLQAVIDGECMIL
ncbi:hypothetical protein C8Q77DRAFT_193174 [Trametes polyzona]|nr:hypothetical protein C8Q77DRAFT_193174 [Trametes polyzona]